MNERTQKLRELSYKTKPYITPERAKLVTQFYKANEGKYSPPIMRAKCFYYICANKKLYLGDEELIVGERGPEPKATPTYPELTCHSLEDLHILHTREKTPYYVPDECFELYAKEIIPYWRGRSLRDRIFEQMEQAWLDAYEAGVFTEFMEQRAPGHTVLDDKIYHMGLLDFKAKIEQKLSQIDYGKDPQAYIKKETLKAFSIACDALILLSKRYAKLARELAEKETRINRRAELLRIAEVCDWVPAHAPRDFHEAIQYYWFCHIGVITELNGWDSFNPGHLDQHLYPFYKKGLEEGTLTEEKARELLECLFIKFNNHPAPPKVGVTAQESNTYTDFANINIGGFLPNGEDGSNELSYMLLDIIEDLHLVQPGMNLQLSKITPDSLLIRTLKVIRKGYGYPSIFNADQVIVELLRQGKNIIDARAGGCSGCVEVGAFGKEAYILTGYFNLPKVLEITLHNGKDPRTGKVIGLRTGEPEQFRTFQDLLNAYATQVSHFVEIKLRGNMIIEQMYATHMPAPFLSVLIDECIEKATDYNAGGARYNTSYIQFVGLGTITDSLSAIKSICYPEDAYHLVSPKLQMQLSPVNTPRLYRRSLKELVSILTKNFEGEEALRQFILHRIPRYGNDDDRADLLMQWVFELCFSLVDGRPNSRGGRYGIQMLPTTCHVYFGSVTGATPDGRLAGWPLSEGISPVQGIDRNGPTAVIRSAAKMDHSRSGGTLLNMKLNPELVKDDEGLWKWAQLIRTYFKLGGHHIQFNVINADTLKKAQTNPEEYRDLIVRVAGYSDYFCDLIRPLQDEIIARTEHLSF